MYYNNFSLFCLVLYSDSDAMEDRDVDALRDDDSLCSTSDGEEESSDSEHEENLSKLLDPTLIDEWQPKQSTIDEVAQKEKCFNSNRSTSKEKNTRCSISVQVKRVAMAALEHFKPPTGNGPDLGLQWVRRYVYEHTGAFVQSRRQVAAWTACRELPGKRSRAPGHKQSKFPGLEAKLLAFFYEQRRNSRRVTPKDLLHQARNYVEANRKTDESLVYFNARWLERFKRRRGIVHRRVQHKQMLCQQDVCSRALSFHQFIHAHGGNACAIVNLDEIPVSFAGPMNDRGTLAAKGERMVTVADSTDAYRRTATVVAALAVAKDAEGHWAPLTLPPFILYKTPNKKISVKVGEGC